MTEKRLYDAITDVIKALICDSVYPSGSRLPGERELALRFNYGSQIGAV